MKTRLKLLLPALFLLCGLSAFSSESDSTVVAKPIFKPSGKLWGYVFGDYATKLSTNSFSMNNVQYGSGTAKNFNSFEFRRIYLGYDYDIDQRFSTQLLLAYEGSSFTSDNARTFYIKQANIKWKNIFKNADLVIGQMSTPTFATTSEGVWGYRSLEKTIMDMRKIGSSNDLGVALQGRFNDRGDYGYTLMIGNGTGQKAETDKNKKIYGDVYAKFFNQKILVDLGADNEISQRLPYDKSKTTIKAFVAYQTVPFTAGVEMFQQTQKNNTIYTSLAGVKDTVNASASGISLFARGVLIDKVLNYVLRYDYYNPDSKFDSQNKYASSYTGEMKESFFLAGLDYAAAKNVHFIPNIWWDHYNNRLSAINNMAGGSNDVTFRITFHYIFK